MFVKTNKVVLQDPIIIKISFKKDQVHPSGRVTRSCSLSYRKCNYDVTIFDYIAHSKTI